ncbi:MAG: hypothetical protein HY722_10930 [Planctomycetes bacterium]|nr:hypothetical protein [Planctomycetota bacterium]
MAAIRRRDPRYAAEAYIFCFEALDHTLKMLGIDSEDKRRHVTGPELLEGVRDLALRNFGALARMVFESWGLRETRDFGHIVFHLVDSGLMGKTEEDRIDDFVGVYQFAAVLDDQWRRLPYFDPATPYQPPPGKAKGPVVPEAEGSATQGTSGGEA